MLQPALPVQRPVTGQALLPALSRLKGHLGRQTNARPLQCACAHHRVAAQQDRLSTQSASQCAKPRANAMVHQIVRRVGLRPNGDGLGLFFAQPPAHGLFFDHLVLLALDRAHAHGRAHAGTGHRAGIKPGHLRPSANQPQRREGRQRTSALRHVVDGVFNKIGASLFDLGPCALILGLAHLGGMGLAQLLGIVRFEPANPLVDRAQTRRHRIVGTGDIGDGLEGPYRPRAQAGQGIARRTQQARLLRCRSGALVHLRHCLPELVEVVALELRHRGVIRLQHLIIRIGIKGPTGPLTQRLDVCRHRDLLAQPGGRSR